MAVLNQDLSGYQAQTGREPLPPGEYNVRITDTGVVTTKSGFSMLKVEMTVIDGQMHGRKIWEQFLLNHGDPKVMQIHMGRLKGMALAAGHPHPDMIKDSEELHGLQLTVRVKIKTDEQYGDKNEISVFKSLPVVQIQPQQQQAFTAPPMRSQVPVTTCPGCGGGKNPTAHLCPACDSKDEAAARATFKAPAPPTMPAAAATGPKLPWQK